MAHVQKKEWTLKIQNSPKGCEKAYDTLFTPEALNFVGELIFSFSKQTDQLNEARKQRRSQLLQSQNLLPEFPRNSAARRSDWKIAPLPAKLMNRRIDVGDVSPANIAHLCEALAADVQGVQVDFDDGHCPLWPNQINGLHAVVQAVAGKLSALPLAEMPVLMLRPRAWNMIEHNAMLNGMKVPGPLFDFGLLIFHLGKTLLNANNGPCFYLSKLEDSSEARLWNEIFVWTQKKLQIPYGSIKACVLIENILAAFQMEEILYELKDHSLGLNCGIWDYAASIIIKLGHRQEFVIPDRNLYVNVKQRFLSSYMALVVSTCHKHGAPATGGMAALLVPDKQNTEQQEVIDKVVMAKQYEVNIGLDGFLIYDLKLIPRLQKLWSVKNPSNLPVVTAADLLAIPTGEITETGLTHNIAVSVLFIYHWLQGQGHFSYRGAVEDSATAEISRSQVWQWVHHKACLDGSGEQINAELIENLTQQFVRNWHGDKRMQIAASCFLEIVLTKNPPEFITSHLNDSRIFCTLAAQCQTKHAPSAKL